MPMDGEQYRVLKEKLDLIERAVIGEEQSGHRGLVKRVDMLETWRTNLDLRIAIYTGFGIAVGFGIRYMIKGSI